MEISPPPVQERIFDPEVFGDDWSVPLESKEASKIREYFRSIKHLEHAFDYINFRVGDTEHVRICAGHVGFGVAAEFRGHGYAGQACRAMAPFVRSVYEVVTITCDPDNHASRRTIERLGARFMDQVAVPEHDPSYQRGARVKRRYRWTP